MEDARDAAGGGIYSIEDNEDETFRRHAPRERRHIAERARRSSAPPRRWRRYPA